MTAAEKKARYYNIAISADRFADLLYTIGLIQHTSYYEVYGCINNVKKLRSMVGWK